MKCSIRKYLWTFSTPLAFTPVAISAQCGKIDKYESQSAKEFDELKTKFINNVTEIFNDKKYNDYKNEILNIEKTIINLVPDKSIEAFNLKKDFINELSKNNLNVFVKFKDSSVDEIIKIKDKKTRNENWKNEFLKFNISIYTDIYNFMGVKINNLSENKKYQDAKYKAIIEDFDVLKKHHNDGLNDIKVASEKDKFKVIKKKLGNIIIEFLELCYKINKLA
ncbi:hypothetical protein [Mycoplasmopsis primatum]|uniref:hypothetical protein n=1 Tax=Mycoplasmopsis primatum TaxID=55604 RepID=UPI000496C8B1|nr:hypothetical protein [Mycoplasmopsis primatum]